MKLLSLFLMSVALLYSQFSFAVWRQVSVPGQPNLIRHLNFTGFLRRVEAEKAAEDVFLFEVEQTEGRVHIRVAFARDDRAIRFRDTFYLQTQIGWMTFYEPETAMRAGLIGLRYAEVVVPFERFGEVWVELQRVVGPLPAVELQPVSLQKSNETPIVEGVVLQAGRWHPPGAGGGGAHGGGSSFCTIQ